MNDIDEPSWASTVVTVVIVVVTILAFGALSIILGKKLKKQEAQRSCVVVSTNITLIPAKPNTITILRNGNKETCYIYKETPNAQLSD